MKAGVYSFVVSFLLLFVFKSREKKVKDDANFVEVIPYSDYFFEIVRYSLIVSLVALVITLIIYLWKKFD